MAVGEVISVRNHQDIYKTNTRFPEVQGLEFVDGEI